MNWNFIEICHKLVELIDVHNIWNQIQRIKNFSNLKILKLIQLECKVIFKTRNMLIIF
jgi:hypothetical protein